MLHYTLPLNRAVFFNLEMEEVNLKKSILAIALMFSCMIASLAYADNILVKSVDAVYTEWYYAMSDSDESVALSEEFSFVVPATENKINYSGFQSRRMPNLTTGLAPGFKQIPLAKLSQVPIRNNV